MAIFDIFAIFFNISGVRYNGPFNSMGAQNIPLIIVVIIVAVALLVIAAVIGKKFFSHFCDKVEVGSGAAVAAAAAAASRGRRRRRSSSRSQTLEFEAVNGSRDVTETTPALDPETPSSGGEYPSSPPTYEESIKEPNPVVLSSNLASPSAPPPPYTPSEHDDTSVSEDRGRGDSNTTTEV